MDARMRNEVRQIVSGQRKRPNEGRVLYLPAHSDGDLGPEEASAPGELRLELTTPQGVASPWFGDTFAMEVLSRWGRERVTVHVLATPHALLHPVVLHQMNALRRVAPNWRLVAHCYRSDLEDEQTMLQASVTAYHELRVVDGMRSNCRAADTKLTIDAMFSAMRTCQAKYGRTTPVLVRCAVESKPDAPVEAAANEFAAVRVG